MHGTPSYLAKATNLCCKACGTMTAENSPESFAIAENVRNGIHAGNHTPEAEVKRLRAGEATAKAKEVKPATVPNVLNVAPALSVGEGWICSLRGREYETHEFDSDMNAYCVPASVIPDVATPEPTTDPHAVEGLIGESRIADGDTPPADAPLCYLTEEEGSRLREHLRGMAFPGPTEAVPPDEALAGPRLFVAVVNALLTAGVYYADICDLLYATTALHTCHSRIEEALR
jgi:hypothetical protein